MNYPTKLKWCDISSHRLGDGSTHVSQGCELFSKAHLRALQIDIHVSDNQGKLRYKRLHHAPHRRTVAWTLSRFDDEAFGELNIGHSVL